MLYSKSYLVFVNVASADTMVKLDYSVRQAIVMLHKEKHTIREISEKVKCSKSVVGRVVKSYNDTGKIVSAFKTGRPRKTSARED